VSDAITTSTAPLEGSFLATGRGKLTLALLCAVTFLDVTDGAIVNVALPTIRAHLGFSVQNLQWVVSGYLITYGGFLLLGGRAGDLLGRRLLIAGTAAGGILWLSRIPVDGTYLGNLLAPLVIMGAGLGLLYAGVQTAANAGVPEHQAGLAAALITTSFQLGSALGLAVFSGIATSRTSHLLAAHTPPPEALTAGFQRALLVSALCLVAAGAIALRASNTRGEPAATPETQQDLEPSYDPA
jgi:MFS family permease